VTLRVFIEELAERDLESHIDFIAADNPRKAAEFIEAVQSAFVRLGELPRIGKVREFRDPRLVGVRSWPIPQFANYLIFYRITETALEVLRVLHGARDIDGALVRGPEDDS